MCSLVQLLYQLSIWHINAKEYIGNYLYMALILFSVVSKLSKGAKYKHVTDYCYLNKKKERKKVHDDIYGLVSGCNECT